MAGGAADGSIGEMTDFKKHSGSGVNPHRQMGPHPHEAVMSPDNRFAEHLPPTEIMTWYKPGGA